VSGTLVRSLAFIAQGKAQTRILLHFGDDMRHDSKAVIYFRGDDGAVTRPERIRLHRGMVESRHTARRVATRQEQGRQGRPQHEGMDNEIRGYLGCAHALDSFCGATPAPGTAMD